MFPLIWPWKGCDEMNKTHFSSRTGVLLRLVHGSKRFFVASILFAWMTSLLDLINPKIISFAVDAVIGEKNISAPAYLQPLLNVSGGISGLRQNIGLIALAILLIALLAGSCRYAFRVMNFRGQERMLKNTRNLLYQHITSLPLTWHNQNHTGDIIQRCTSDVDVIRSFLSDHITTLIRMVVSILLSIAFMMSISWKLTLMVCCFIPVIILFGTYVIFNGANTSFGWNLPDWALYLFASERIPFSLLCVSYLFGVYFLRLFFAHNALQNVRRAIIIWFIVKQVLPAGRRARPPGRTA